MIRLASSTVATGSVVPGTIGTPAAAITRRASVLSPIRRIASGDGPMNVSPALAHASAKRQSSDRKP